MDAVNYATESYLRDELAKATLKISQLEDDKKVMTTFREDLIVNSNKIHERLTRIQDSLKSWTRGQLRDELITTDQAYDLAQIGDFTLSQSYDVTVTVEHTFMVDVEPGEDIDDVIGTLNFSVDSYHTSLMNEDYSIVETNYDECD